MKKKALLRGLLGFPLGIAIGYIITILISLFYGQGYYLPCVPSLAESAGSELGAVLLQAVLCGLLGSCFASCSIIWELDSWSILKQTGVHFLITAFVMLPIAYINKWMEHSIGGFLLYLAVFIIIFALIWLIQYIFWKNKIKEINQLLNKE